MTAVSLNAVNEIVEQHYIPAFKRTQAEQRLHMERWRGVTNPMPFFDWWPLLGRAVAAPSNIESRLSRAWRELCTGDL